MAAYKHKPIPLDDPKFTQRFWSRVAINSDTECWLWCGTMSNNGYGRFSYGYNPQKHYNTHRVAYALHAGSDPGEMVVCHRCDNPQCVNPHHLFLGTQADNIADKCLKGRQARGDSSPSRKYPWMRKRGTDNNKAKLTDNEVRRIRTELAGTPTRQLARMFGVHQKTMISIVRGKTWAHVV